MQDEEMGYGRHGLGAPCGIPEVRVATPGKNPVWVGQHLSGSIYLLACGARASEEDAEVKLSDRFIGWLILLLQGLAYTTLAVRDERSSSEPGSYSVDSTGGDSGYSIASVTGVMYLLVASTTPDLRAGFSLLVDGTRVGLQLLGVGLLMVYALMIGAAMKVLLSSAQDDTSVVMNAVAVLFIADLVRVTGAAVRGPTPIFTTTLRSLRMRKRFHLTVPQQWRLFWAIHSMAISFVLALVAVVYVGDASKVSNKDESLFDNVPSWFIWVVNPAAVTLCSFTFSVMLQAISEASGEAAETVVIGELVYARLYAAMKEANERIRFEPLFYAALSLWLADGVITWWFLVWHYRFPVAVDFPSPSEIEDGLDGLTATNNIVAFIFSNTSLAIGLAWMVLGVIVPGRGGAPALLTEAHSTFSDSSVGGEDSVSLEGSRVPSLLVGWGIGYWVTSLLYILGGSWNQGGWLHAPVTVSVVAYVVLPCFFLAGIFMVADSDFLGARFGALVEPTVKGIQNRRTVWYWIIATVLRDVLFLWTLMWYVLMHSLNNF